MASESTRARAAGVVTAAASVPAATETHDLEKPERQLEILRPKTVGYVLEFSREVVLERIEGGQRIREPQTQIISRPIEVNLEFTIGQIITRATLDDLDAFIAVVTAEVQRLSGGRSDSRIDMMFLKAALMKGSTRAILRELVSGMARFTDTEPGKPEERPTVLGLEQGMKREDLDALGLLLLTEYMEHRDSKKAQAGA